MTAASSTTIPSLWMDWCAVTHTDPQRRDPEVIERFALQASPSQRLLKVLQPPVAPSVDNSTASAWPDGLQLESILSRCHQIATSPDSTWIARLRSRRLGFCAAALAPRQQGGLGLTRGQLVNLTTQELTEHRQQLRAAASRQAGLEHRAPATPMTCPSCAIWWWLQIVGTASGWSHWSVRDLAHRMPAQARVANSHVHEREDPSPDWQHAVLLMAIDQWGYLEQYAPLHVSSLSTLIASITDLSRMEPAALVSAANDRDSDQSEPQHVTPEREAAILARADELNRRIDEWFAQHG